MHYTFSPKCAGAKLWPFKSYGVLTHAPKSSLNISILRSQAKILLFVYQRSKLAA